MFFHATCSVLGSLHISCVVIKFITQKVPSADHLQTWELVYSSPKGTFLNYLNVDVSLYSWVISGILSWPISAFHSFYLVPRQSLVDTLSSSNARLSLEPSVHSSLEYAYVYVYAFLHALYQGEIAMWVDVDNKQGTLLQAMTDVPGKLIVWPQLLLNWKIQKPMRVQDKVHIFDPFESHGCGMQVTLWFEYVTPAVPILLTIVFQIIWMFLA